MKEQEYISPVIKKSNEEILKAKRRLIGSIVMLLIALIVLLNVTSKVRPLPVKPELVLYKPNANSKIIASNINTIAPISTTASIASNSMPNAIPYPIPNDITNDNTNTNLNAPKLNKTSSVVINENIENKITSIISKLNPVILPLKIKATASAEDILNGQEEYTVTIKYYVLFVNTKDHNFSEEVKTALKSKGVNTILVPYKNSQGVSNFKVRSPLFNTKEAADLYLQQYLAKKDS